MAVLRVKIPIDIHHAPRLVSMTTAFKAVLRLLRPNNLLLLIRFYCYFLFKTVFRLFRPVGQKKKKNRKKGTISVYLICFDLFLSDHKVSLLITNKKTLDVTMGQLSRVCSNLPCEIEQKIIVYKTQKSCALWDCLV